LRLQSKIDRISQYYHYTSGCPRDELRRKSELQQVRGKGIGATLSVIPLCLPLHITALDVQGQIPSEDVAAYSIVAACELQVAATPRLVEYDRERAADIGT